MFSDLKHLSRSIGCKNQAFIVGQAIHDKVIKEKILCMYALQIQKVKAFRCARKTFSVLHDAITDAVTKFLWETIMSD